MILPARAAGLKRPFLIGCTAAALTTLVTLLLPNHYKSEARVLPVESKGMAGGLGNIASVAASLGMNVPGGDSSDANFVDILTSRTIREKLLETQFTYQKRSWRFARELMCTETLEAYLGEKNRDRSLKAIAKVLTASRDIKSKIIIINAETKSPALSQQVVKRTLELLEAFVQEKGRTRGGAKATFAEGRLEDAQKDMTQVEDDFRSFLDGNRNYLMSNDPGVRLKGMRLEAELKLRQQLVTTLALNREQALLEEKNDVPILNVLDTGHLPIEKSWPSRAQYIALVFLMGTCGAWGWLNRTWIMSRILETS